MGTPDVATASVLVHETSPDGLVSVTLGPHGGLVDVRISERGEHLSGARLGSHILRLVAAAQARRAHRVATELLPRERVQVHPVEAETVDEPSDTEPTRERTVGRARWSSGRAGIVGAVGAVGVAHSDTGADADDWPWWEDLTALLW